MTSILAAAGFLQAAERRGGVPAEEDRAKYYKRWVEEDVAYIITDEEKAIFKRLTTDDERDKFIEQFWVRRNPSAASQENTFKAEHYRRIAYANDHFASGKPGWRTDRGRIYILFGKPDEIQHNPSGHIYNRDLKEGGGNTTTFPYEVWRYRHIDGIGDGIEIEFVDSTLSGEYRMAISPEEKDALLYASGAGSTLLEQLGYETREDRIRDMGIKNVSGKSLFRWGELNHVFERYQKFYQMRRPPEIQFKDLQQIVTTRIGYSVFPMECTWFFIQLSPGMYMVPVTLSIPNSALRFKDHAGGVRQAKVELYGMVQSLSNAVVYEFEDTIVKEVSTEQALSPRVMSGSSLYQRCIPMPPGRYKMTVVAKDVQSGNTTLLDKSLYLPSRADGKLATSSLVLGDSVSPAARGESMTDPFVLEGNLKIYPNVPGRVRNGTSLVGYLEVYNLTVDSKSLQPDWDVKIEVSAGGKAVEVPPDSVSQIFPIFRGDKLVLFWMQTVRAGQPGEYLVKALVRDKIGDVTAEASANIHVY